MNIFFFFFLYVGFPATFCFQFQNFFVWFYTEKYIIIPFGGARLKTGKGMGRSHVLLPWSCCWSGWRSVPRARLVIITWLMRIIQQQQRAPRGGLGGGPGRLEVQEAPVVYTRSWDSRTTISILFSEQTINIDVVIEPEARLERFYTCSFCCVMRGAKDEMLRCIYGIVYCFLERQWGDEVYGRSYREPRACVDFYYFIFLDLNGKCTSANSCAVDHLCCCGAQPSFIRACVKWWRDFQGIKHVLRRAGAIIPSRHCSAGISGPKGTKLCA